LDAKQDLDAPLEEHFLDFATDKKHEFPTFQREVHSSLSQLKPLIFVDCSGQVAQHFDRIVGSSINTSVLVGCAWVALVK
jgi:hypothetical protein